MHLNTEPHSPEEVLKILNVTFFSFKYIYIYIYIYIYSELVSICRKTSQATTFVSSILFNNYIHDSACLYKILNPMVNFNSIHGIIIIFIGGGVPVSIFIVAGYFYIIQVLPYLEYYYI